MNGRIAAQPWSSNTPRRQEPPRQCAGSEDDVDDQERSEHGLSKEPPPCTGSEPNPSSLSTEESLVEPFSERPNPAEGPSNQKIHDVRETQDASERLHRWSQRMHYSQSHS